MDVDQKCDAPLYVPDARQLKEGMSRVRSGWSEAEHRRRRMQAGSWYGDYTAPLIFLDELVMEDGSPFCPWWLE